ncbi:MAG: His/Gly/Thr/Pro-type tRNA ligase C-terminal domain-containing protein, partial [Bacillota bacterium]
GGKPTPAVGFGMGIERLIMVAEATGVSLSAPAIPTIYIAPLGSSQYIKAYALVQELRAKGISADMDFMDKSLKAQMKYADKIGYKYVVVLGESEVESGMVMLKDMKVGRTTEVAISELYKILGE